MQTVQLMVGNILFPTGPGEVRTRIDAVKTVEVMARIDEVRSTMDEARARTDRVTTRRDRMRMDMTAEEERVV